MPTVDELLLIAKQKRFAIACVVSMLSKIEAREGTSCKTRGSFLLLGAQHNIEPASSDGIIKRYLGN